MDSFGLKSDQISIVLASFLTLFWGFIYNQIPVNWVSARHLYSPLVSFLTYYTLYENANLYSLIIPQLVTFIYVTQCSELNLIERSVESLFGYDISTPRPTIDCSARSKEPRLPWDMFFFNMGWLVYTQYQNDSMATASIMMQTIRLIKFSSTRPGDSRVSYGRDDNPSCTPRPKVEVRMTKSFGPGCIRDDIDLIEFLGYINFFPTFFVGPPLDFHVYKNTIGNRPNSSITNIWSWPPFIQSMLFASGYLYFRDWNMEYILTDQYQSLWLFQRFYYTVLSGSVYRMKYYAVWKLSEASCRNIGAVLDTSNINISSIETATSLQNYIKNWNTKTQEWLKYYIYKPLLEMGFSRIFATLFTFTTSACWHGLYPGYFLTFWSVGLFLQVNRILARREIFSGATSHGRKMCLWQFSGWFMTQSVISYICIPFVLLNFNQSIEAWSRMYFIPHIISIAIIAWDYVRSFGSG